MDSVFDLLRKYEKKGDFAHSSVTQQMIKEAEERLGAKLTEAYKKFLLEFGFGGLDGIETLGIAKMDEWLLLIQHWSCAHWECLKTL